MQANFLGFLPILTPPLCALTFIMIFEQIYSHLLCNAIERFFTHLKNLQCLQNVKELLLTASTQILIVQHLMFIPTFKEI
jgi:hypothetical protein